MKGLLLGMALMAACSTLHAQDYSRKAGNITDYELTLDTYGRDTAAAAVILYETTTVDYTITQAGIQQHRSYYIKAKILRPDGADIADFTIPYYYSSNTKEYVSGISAVSWNKEDGKKVETQLKKQYIFDEKVTENLNRIKFSVPNAKVGSVIEVKYKIQSDRAGSIDDIDFQHGYPTVYSSASVKIPEYFVFSVSSHGFHPLKSERGTESALFQVGSYSNTYVVRVFECEAENLPALKEESMVWCADDFRSKLVFELDGVRFPGEPYKQMTSTWKSVYETLEKTEFDKGSRISCPYKAEVAAICSAQDDPLERIAAIHKLVVSRIGWNERYRLYPDNPRAAADKGTGNSADINMVLNSALKAAGLRTELILLNPRHYGRLPNTRPSIDKINTFVIRVTLADGNAVYLDGTSKYSGPNMLPPALRVDRARVFGSTTDDGWVDLSRLSANTLSGLVLGRIETNGTLAGSISKQYSSAMAMSKKRQYAAARDQDKYIEELEQEDHIEISDYTITGLETNVINEQFDFTKQMTSAGDLIYINSTVIPFMDRNPLTEQERKLPVEFTSPDNYVISCSLTLPEGYVVEELPKNIRITACGDGVSVLYMTQVNGSLLQILFKYKMDSILYTEEEYLDLREFFGHVAALSTSNIVLKKI